MAIHKTAIIDPSAHIGKNVSIGPYSIIGPSVAIGDNTRIASHARLECNTMIGPNTTISMGAALGLEPQDVRYTGAETWLEIGANAVLREYCTISRGSTGKTVIGENFTLMTYGHVEHDCSIGDNVVISKSAILMDGICVGNGAIIGSLTFINRGCRIGELCFVGGGFNVVKDVPPFILAGDEPLQILGVNTVALRKKGVPETIINAITQIYKKIQASKDDLRNVVDDIAATIEHSREIDAIIAFISGNGKGIV